MRIGVNAKLLREKYHTGIQAYISNLYKAIVSADKDNEYFFLDDGLGSSRLLNVFYNNLLVRNQIKKIKIDIFHAANSILPLGPKGCCYVSTIHDLGFKTIPQWTPKAEIVYYNLVFENIIKKADLIVADSLFVKQEIKDYYGVEDQKLRVAPLGLNEFYLEKEVEPYLEDIRKKYRLKGKKVVLANSAHCNRKNIDSLVNAFVENSDRLKDADLVIAGATGKTTFQSLINPDNKAKITVAGYLPIREQRALYQIADIFIYPSLYEGFGLPILEAMASGCLVFASNIPPVREIVADDNLLFNPLAIGEICEKIRYYLDIENSKKQLLIGSYREILGKFTWRKAAEEMISIFNSLKP
ncbi:MAG: glycosyltransferase family 1 protein [bacterium]|nr:glycosyltransferase family 1 protein [bacterium]